MTKKISSLIKQKNELVKTRRELALLLGLEKARAKGKNKLVFVDAANPESIKGLKDAIKLNKELLELENNPAEAERLRTQNASWQAEIDFLNKKIELEEYLNILYEERNEEKDEEFDFDTRSRAFQGIGSDKLPGQGGFQALLPLLQAKFEAQGGGDADAMEEFFDLEEKAYLDKLS